MGTMVAYQRVGMEVMGGLSTAAPGLGDLRTLSDDSLPAGSKNIFEVSATRDGRRNGQKSRFRPGTKVVGRLFLPI